MIRYPITFSANAQALNMADSPWEVSASGNIASCSIPQEFDGPGGALSPEDFFLLALSNCFIATFKVYANASQIKYGKIHVDSTLTLERDTINRPFAKGCVLNISVTDANDSARTLMILKKVARSGILLNSVKTEITFAFTINGELAL